MAARLALAGFGALLVLAPSTGHAQRAAHLSTRDISDQDRARDTMARFAACVVKARPNLTKEALAKAAGAESVIALQDLVKTECLAGGELRMDPAIFRGALYRELYLREFGESAGTPQVSAASEGVPAQASIEAFGDCVMRTAPAATRVFVVADVATPEERQALADLAPALGSCVDPRAQLRFNRASLEATLAEALYKNSVAPSQGAASVGGTE